MYRYFSSSHKGLLVCVPPASRRMGTPSLPHSSSPLCFSELSCTAAPPFRSVAHSFSRHVEPPSSPTGQHKRGGEKKSLSPLKAVSHSADRRLRQIRGVHTLQPALLLAVGGEEKVEGKVSRLLFIPAALNCFTWSPRCAEERG